MTTPDALVHARGLTKRYANGFTAVDAVDFVARVREARSRSEAGAGAADPASLNAYDEALNLWRGDALSDFATEQVELPGGYKPVAGVVPWRADSGAAHCAPGAPAER